MHKILLIFFTLFSFQNSTAQETITRKDSLQGGMRPERTCFDILRYDLNIKINPEEKSIVGYNNITFKVVTTTSKIQMKIAKLSDIGTINSVPKTSKYSFNL